MKARYFKEKVMWITGATSGIGRSTAKMIAPLVSKLIISGRQLDKLKELSVELESLTDVYIISFDMNSPKEIATAMDANSALLSEVNLMYHNAGISMRSLVEETELDVYRKVMQVNYFSVVQLSQFLLPSFKQNGGHFVVINSMAGKFGVPYRSGYSASKMALVGYFDAMQAELAETDLRVTMVYPGFINTEISKNALTGKGQLYGQMDSGQANGMPVEIAVKKILTAVSIQKTEVLIGGFKETKLASFMSRFFPSLFKQILVKSEVR